MDDRQRALVVGVVAWSGIIAAYVAALVLKGRPDVPRALVYNAPIALLFLVMAAYGVIRAMSIGLFESARGNAAIIALWTVGFGVLYLRLVAKTPEVSGHLAWLPMLTVQAWWLGFPRSLVAVAIAGFLAAAWLKFMVFGGPSGAPGLLVGMALMAAMLAAIRSSEKSCP